MAVKLERDAEATMAEHLLHDLGMHALSQQQTPAGITQRMERCAVDVRLAAQRPKTVGNFVGEPRP